MFQNEQNGGAIAWLQISNEDRTSFAILEITSCAFGVGGFQFNINSASTGWLGTPTVTEIHSISFYLGTGPTGATGGTGATGATGPEDILKIQVFS